MEREYTSEEQLKVEEPILIDPALEIDISDEDFVALMGRKIDAAEAFYKDKLKLPQRRKENKKFYLGDQVDESSLYDYEKPAYKDNILWQDTEKRISLASGRLPDVITTPGGREQENKDNAKTLERYLDIRIDNDGTRRMVKSGLRHLLINLTAAIKVRWDPNRGENGDFLFELVNPIKIGYDHTATIPDDGFSADNMEIIYEWLEEPVGVILAKFPNKKDELYRELGWTGAQTRRLASKIKYLEIHFTWYDKDGKKIEGVGWKYKNLVLGKTKTPFWDYKGVDTNPSIDEMGQPTSDKVFKNFFDQPRKPYIIFSHINLGEGPIDDTSSFEQSIPLQKIVNKRGQQITKISDRAIPKKVFAGKYITKEQAERCTNDPDEDIYLDGLEADNVNNAVGTIRSDAPSPMLYNDMVGARGQIDSKFATHGVTRGETSGNESGTSKQITREGDLVDSDDIVGIVVERVTYEMASWAIQMIKTQYDKPHYVSKMGKDGEMLEAELSSDLVDDGVAVSVKSNTTDKATQRNLALDLAARKAIDPLSMFEDLDVPNPKERATRLVAFLAGAVDGYARYGQVIGMDVNSGQPVAEDGTGAPTDGQPVDPNAAPVDDGAQQAALDIQRIMAGEVFEPETIPTMAYVQTLMDFAQTPDFDALPPEIQQNFITYIQTLKGMVDSDVNQMGGQDANAIGPGA